MNDDNVRHFRARPFTEQLCDRCIGDNPETHVYCPIVSKALIARIIPAEWSLDSDGAPHCTKFAESFGVELEEAPKERPLPDQKGADKLGKSFGEELLDAGYDNGFGITSLDTLLCEEMSRAQRIDFAEFLIRTVQEHFTPNTEPEKSDG